MKPRHPPSLFGVFWLAGPALAWAVEAQTSFQISGRPPGEAALAVGLQAGVTLGVSVSCHGAPVSLSGRMSSRKALERVLAGSDCSADWIDAQTVRIVRRMTPARAPAKPIAPAASAAPVVATTALAEVIVTASKRELTDFDLPGSVSVQTAAVLSAVQARETSDLRLLASGVTVTNLGPGRDKVLLRGLSDGAFTGHTQSTVGLYWSQTPTTYNAPDPDLRLIDVQSVDVLRGPQGSLYGAGSISGVVSVTPAAPDPAGRYGAMSAIGAVTASGDPSVGVEAMFNAPLAGGKAAARVVVYGEDDGGYIDLPLQHLRNANHTQDSGGRAALLVAPAPDWSVTLGDIYQDIYSDDTQYTTGDPAALQRDTRVREPHDNDFEQAYLDVKGKGGWGQLHSIGSFIHHVFDSRYDASTALPDFGGVAGPGAYDDGALIRLTSEELDYRPPWKGPVSLLLGVYGDYGDEHQIARLAPVNQPALYNEDRTDRLVDLAAFAESSYALTRRLTLTLGLRQAYAERHTFSLIQQATGQHVFDGRMAARARSPKIAADYALNRGLRLYALVSKGYRVGGFNTAGPLDVRFTRSGGAQPNRVYHPDSLWNYEAGLKLQAWQGRLEGRTAIYYDIWRRLQADQFLPSGLPYVANVGEARVAGWEWETSFRPLPPVVLQLGALFTEPELRRVDPTFPAGQSDFTLPGVPRRSMNGRMAYEWSLGEGRTLQLDAAAVYVGHSYLFFGPQGSSEMGRYLDTRLGGDLDMTSYRLGLQISNPANSRGDTFAFGNPFTLSSEQQATPLRPRTVRLTLTRNF